MKLEAATPAPGGPRGRSVRLGGRDLPVILPTLRDPRLHLAAVIVSLQVLGQVALGFQLSIAQILVAVLTCGLLETGITLWRRKVLMWPASALLTGNGVAFILRATGTRHGDWWSLHGAGYFALAALIGLGSKYVVRAGDRPVFNPSNLGLVVVLVVFGSRVANPQDLWWGPMSPGLALALAVIAVGGTTIVWRLRMFGLVAAFWLTFAAGTGLVAASGHCMTARWHLGPVCGGSFWWVLAASPEIFVFMFFMITDPKTSPSGRVSRAAYGAGVGLLAALAVAPAATEFWTKVGVLAALVVVCGLRPAWERVLPLAGSQEDRLGSWLRLRRGVPAVALGALVPVAAGALVLAGTPARPAAASAASQVPMARPSVAISPPAVPAVTIDESIRHFDAAITQAQAQQMAQDLAGDLAIEAEALQTRNAALAASADSGRWLATVTGEITKAGPSGVLSVPTYTFSHLTVELVTNPARPQDPPTIGVLAAGTLSEVAEGGAAPPGGRTAPYNGSFGLALAGGHYLIIGEYNAADE